VVKTILILALGIIVGYKVGFDDAKRHDTTIVARALERVGGETRDKYRTDVDRQMDQVERR
jgi:hypothetical protein